MQKLFLFILFFPLFGLATEIDCQDRQNITSAKCLLRSGCADVNDIEIGGAKFSNFETMSCFDLIAQYKKSESEGALIERMNKLMRKTGISSIRLVDCPSEPLNEKEKCVSGIQQLISKFESDRYAFVDALKFKVAVYDSLFQLKGKTNLVGVGCDTDIRAKTPADFDYNKSEYGNDCRLIHLNDNLCYLKPGTKPNYPVEARTYEKDRNECQKFIEDNTKLTAESSAAVLQKEEQQIKDSKRVFVQKTVDCGKFDAFKLASWQLSRSNVDGILNCLLNTSAGKTNPNSQSGRVKKAN